MDVLLGKRLDFRAIVGVDQHKSTLDHLSVSTLGSSVTDSYGRPFYEGLFIYSTPGLQTPIVLPPALVLAFTASVVGSGQYALQVTTDPIALLQSSPADVLWVEWDRGATSETVQETLFPCTALRVRLVSGTCRLSIRGC